MGWSGLSWGDVRWHGGDVRWHGVGWGGVMLICEVVKGGGKPTGGEEREVLGASPSLSTPPLPPTLFFSQAADFLLVEGLLFSRTPAARSPACAPGRIHCVPLWQS